MCCLLALLLLLAGAVAVLALVGFFSGLAFDALIRAISELPASLAELAERLLDIAGGVSNWLRGRIIS
jgi:hypothetical protein